MPELIVHGVPSGQQVSKCDTKLRYFFDQFYSNHKPGIIKQAFRRQDNDVIYSYIVYENSGKNFSDFNGRAGSYFGMSLVFHNQYVQNQEVLFKLFEKTYNDYVKNKIISENAEGTRKWMVPNLTSPGDVIAKYIGNGLMLLSTNPELDPKILPLPPLQNQPQRH